VALILHNGFTATFAGSRNFLPSTHMAPLIGEWPTRKPPGRAPFTAAAHTSNPGVRFFLDRYPQGRVLGGHVGARHFLGLHNGEDENEDD